MPGVGARDSLQDARGCAGNLMPCVPKVLCERLASILMGKVGEAVIEAAG